LPPHVLEAALVLHYRVQPELASPSVETRILREAEVVVAIITVEDVVVDSRTTEAAPFLLLADLAATRGAVLVMTVGPVRHPEDRLRHRVLRNRRRNLSARHCYI